MDSEMLVALPRAAADKLTLFAHHSCRAAGEAHTLNHTAGRDHAFGEAVLLGDLRLPQPRRTHSVVAVRAGLRWGLEHGLNEHGLAAGRVPYRSKLAAAAGGLTGPDLVRLALERCTGARQAVDLAADLIVRHGQGEVGPDGTARDCALMFADRGEAFLLVVAGGHWAVQEARQVRAAGAACHVRADWDRVSRGLADLVIERRWWPEDGSKIDFEGTVGSSCTAPAALRRWGQMTLLLEEENGRLDVGTMRGLLAGLAGPRDRMGLGPSSPAVTEWAGLVAQCGEVPLAWCSFGPADAAVWLPLLPCGDVPPDLLDAGLRRRAERLAALVRCADETALAVREGLAQLQHRLDNETRDFVVEAAAAAAGGDAGGSRRQAGLFMEHALELYDDAAHALLAEARPARRPAGVWG
jgi:hypothetical protein